MIDNSQLPLMKPLTTGISLTSGSAWGAKMKATTAAAIQPTIARLSRTKPRE